MRKIVLRGFAGIIAISIVMGFFSVASAERFSGGSYIIDASVIGNSVGGAATGGSYNLTSSGGESIIGNGAGGSYKIGTGYVAQLPKSMQLTVQPSGLMAYYPLDETSGTFIADYSATPTNGTLVAAPTFVAGKLGGGITFNGTTQYASLGSTSSLQGTTFTLEAWVKTSTSGATMAVLAKGSNYWLGFNFGKVAIYDWTTSVTCKTPASYTDGNWHHIAATLVSGASNGSIIYVDGVQRQTCTWTPVVQNGQPGLGASKGGSWAQFYNGSIDHAKIFNRAMTADEVQTEYQAGNAGSTAGVSLGAITSGVSRSADADITIRTDSASYSVAVNQDHDLQSGANTIPAISDAIATPGIWSEGTTKGLGFSLSSAPGLDAKWSSGTKFAYFPSAATTLYNRTAATLGTKDLITMKIRADVAISQPEGDYQNTITVTGTTIP